LVQGVDAESKTALTISPRRAQGFDKANLVWANMHELAKAHAAK